jgi:hypothetical protein
MRAVRSGRNGLTRLLAGVTVCFGIYSGSVLAQDVLRTAPYAVGVTQLEYVDPSEGGRPLNLRQSRRQPPFLSRSSWPPICTCTRTRQSCPMV